MFRTGLIAAVVGALALPAAALDLDLMSPHEREAFGIAVQDYLNENPQVMVQHEAFGTAVRDYLMQNPQVIMDAVAVLEERQQAEQARADFDLVANNTDALFNDDYSFVGGNPDGDITLVEFLDYRCGFCRRAFPEVEKLLETDGNIRLVVKEFPILGDQSVLASRFAIATKSVEGMEAYKALHDTLMQFNGDIGMPALSRMAKSLGYDVAAIQAAMDSEEVNAEIAANRALAQRLQISGTPTFVMQDELLRGYLPYDQLLAIVEEKRS